MEQYKESIEAIVAPLRAPEHDKNNLRRELWTHFNARVEEERGRGVDDGAAGNNALECLGTPDEIRAAFLNEMHPFVRALYRFDYELDRVPARYNAVTAAIILVVSLFMSALLLVGFSWQDPEFTSERFLMLGVMGLSFCLWHSVWIFLALVRRFQWEHAARIIFREKQSFAKFIRMTTTNFGLGVLLATAAFYVGYLFLVARLGEFHTETIAYLYVAPFIFTFIGLVQAIVIPLAVFRSEQHAQYIPDWPYQVE